MKRIEKFINKELAGIKDVVRLEKIFLLIKKSLKEMKNRDIYDKRISINDYISILIYRSGTIEVHINVKGVVSTYESFEGVEI